MLALFALRISISVPSLLLLFKMFDLFFHLDVLGALCLNFKVQLIISCFSCHGLLDFDIWCITEIRSFLQSETIWYFAECRWPGCYVGLPEGKLCNRRCHWCWKGYYLFTFIFILVQFVNVSILVHLEEQCFILSTFGAWSYPPGPPDIHYDRYLKCLCT